jgi:hypothetical protein
MFESTIITSSDVLPLPILLFSLPVTHIDVWDQHFGFACL